MTNSAALLIGRCGFSQREAAEFLKVSVHTVQSWAQGSRRCPEGVLDELAVLYERIDRTAQQIMAHVAELTDHGVDPDEIIASTMTDAQARERGWPCAAPANAAVGIVLGLSPHAFTVKPLNP